MDTVVVVFENPSVICLKALSKTVQDLVYPLRIFPMQMQKEKIIKRWALIKTDKDFAFVEKEERCERLEEFITQLRVTPCTVLINMTMPIKETLHFHIDAEKKTLSMYIKEVKVESFGVECINSAIIQGSNVFFKRAIISLIGIRIRNKAGKKETVDISIGVEKAQCVLPKEMNMIQTQPKGVTMVNCRAATESKLLLKVLSRNVLFFESTVSGLFLKLELIENIPSATFFRELNSITPVQSCMPFMKKHYLQEYLVCLSKKYTDEIKMFTRLFYEKSDIKDHALVIGNQMKWIEELSSDKQNKVLLGIYDILTTLQFPDKDRRASVLSTLKKMYTDLIKIKAPATIYMYVKPSISAPPSSLHSLFKELEM